LQYTLKKQLGQHFLKDEQVCKKIVAALQQHPFERLIEVGPGGGALTKFLLKLPDVDFTAIELDEEKVQYLHHTYPVLQDKIIHASILDVAFPFEQEATVVGNFPYNISTQIVFKVLEWKEQVPVMIGMFQKEVAQRIVSPHGSKVYGILSVLAQTFYHAEYLFEVDEQAFNPPPKVKSAVIRLVRKEQVSEMRSQKDLFSLVKMAFNQRRKTLRNATRALFPEEVLQDDLFNKRAEQLPIETFAALTFKMK
jgi:16S rRNA (adenine1518-N6/adenine1519-N6)-dimethyltransferase